MSGDFYFLRRRGRGTRNIFSEAISAAVCFVCSLPGKTFLHARREANVAQRRLDNLHVLRARTPVSDLFSRFLLLRFFSRGWENGPNGKLRKSRNFCAAINFTVNRGFREEGPAVRKSRV